MEVQDCDLGSLLYKRQKKNSDPIHFYLQYNDLIKNFIFNLKNTPFQDNHSTNSEISSNKDYLFKVIIQMLSTTKKLPKELINHALITIDNMLTFDFNIIKDVHLPKQLIINLSNHFIELCSQPKSSDDSISLQLYSTIYFIMVIIHQINSPEQQKMYMKYLFKNTMVTEFLNLRFKKEHKIERLIGSLIVWLTKKLNLNYWAEKIKKFLLENLVLADQQKIKIRFFYCFNQCIRYKPLTLSQVRKNAFDSFIRQSLTQCYAEDTSLKNQQISDIYNIKFFAFSLSKSILQNNPILIYEFIQPNFMQCIAWSLQNQEKASLQLFELLSPYLPISTKQKLYRLLLKQKLVKGLQLNIYQLKILNLLVGSIDDECCIQLYRYTFVLVNSIQQNSCQSKQQLQIKEVLKNVLNRIKQFNSEMSKLLINLCQLQKYITLDKSQRINMELGYIN